MGRARTRGGVARDICVKWSVRPKSLVTWAERADESMNLVDLKLGLIPVRISTDDEPEVVWCSR
jgi:hypothetical protein